MEVFKELKQTKDKVKGLLEKYSTLRDSDNKLVSSFLISLFCWLYSFAYTLFDFLYIN